MTDQIQPFQAVVTHIDLQHLAYERGSTGLNRSERVQVKFFYDDGTGMSHEAWVAFLPQFCDPTTTEQQHIVEAKRYIGDQVGKKFWFIYNPAKKLTQIQGCLSQLDPDASEEGDIHWFGNVRLGAPPSTVRDCVRCRSSIPKRIAAMYFMTDSLTPEALTMEGLLWRRLGFTFWLCPTCMDTLQKRLPEPFSAIVNTNILAHWHGRLLADLGLAETRSALLAKIPK